VATAVPGAVPRRREGSHADHQQDAEPGMEHGARPAHCGRAEPPARGVLLGQGPLWQGLHGRV
jgi:hypothetical protein